MEVPFPNHFSMWPFPHPPQLPQPNLHPLQPMHHPPIYQPMPMMPAHPPRPAPVHDEDSSEEAPGAGGKMRRTKRRKALEGGPKKPATSFVLFSNTVREKVKAENPGIAFLDLGKKLGEMWRDMDPDTKKGYIEQATQQKDKYLQEKREWLASRALGSTIGPR